MPKYKNKSKVNCGRALQNYWKLRKQQNSELQNQELQPLTEIYDLSGMEVAEEAEQIMPFVELQPLTEIYDLSGMEVAEEAEQIMPFVELQPLTEIYDLSGMEVAEEAEQIMPFVELQPLTEIYDLSGMEVAEEAEQIMPFVELQPLTEIYDLSGMEVAEEAEQIMPFVELQPLTEIYDLSGMEVAEEAEQIMPFVELQPLTEIYDLSGMEVAEEAEQIMPFVELQPLTEIYDLSGMEVAEEAEQIMPFVELQPLTEIYDLSGMEVAEEAEQIMPFVELQPLTEIYDLSGMEVAEEAEQIMPFVELQPLTEIYDLSGMEVAEEAEQIMPVEQDEEDLPDLIIEEESQAETKNISGRRVIDLNYFFSKIQEIGSHGAFNCGIQSLKLIGEKRVGLASKFTLECLMCKEKFSLCNVTGDLDINTVAVAGAVSVGIGYSQLEELLSAVDLPIMTKPVYQKRHDIASNAWDKALSKSMNEAAEEEKRIALQNGHVSKDGIPIIDVVVDGCWSKRSYKKNYSALSGAAAIIGRHTKKILFLGIKNKYCSICTQDLNKNKNPRAHQCFKNFTGPSTAMESTIIVEGFKSSIEMYGLIYGRLISDGDSSTYAKILEARPYPQFTVEKVECRNHLLRNLCNKLENLTTDTKYPISFRKLITKKRIMSIRSAIRKCSKKYHDSLENLNFSTQKLFEDIQTVHLHAFGNHTKCKSHFCNKPQNDEIIPQAFFTSSLWQKICFFVNAIAGHSRSLVHDVDSNIVESFHSIVAKFVGGKRVNYSCRRGYQTRCSASAVNFNTKRKPVSILYKTIVGQSPKGRMSTLDNKYRTKRKLLKHNIHKYKKQQTHGTVNKDYGEQTIRPDVSDAMLEQMKENFLSNLYKSEEERRQIERQTILQSESSEWLELRRSLLTASNFGRVIKMRPDTSCASIVKQLLYKINIDSAPVQHGREHEKKALDQLSIQEGVEIRPCGLFIDPEIPYLGATPDGLIGEEAIVEVKCPISAHKIGLDEAIAQKKVNFWVKDNSGTLQVNSYFIEIDR